MIKKEKTERHREPLSEMARDYSKKNCRSNRYRLEGTIDSLSEVPDTNRSFSSKRDISCERHTKAINRSRFVRPTWFKRR